MRYERPHFRAFLENNTVNWYRINPDGTPAQGASWNELTVIAMFFQEAVFAGDSWVVDFFTALKTNGKANLRGESQ